MKIEVDLPRSAARDLADVMATYGLTLDDAVALLIVAGAAELTRGYVDRLLGDVVRRDRT